jgi:hypothetical protein
MQDSTQDDSRITRLLNKPLPVSDHQEMGILGFLTEMLIAYLMMQAFVTGYIEPMFDLGVAYQAMYLGATFAFGVWTHYWFYTVEMQGERFPPDMTLTINGALWAAHVFTVAILTHMVFIY